MQKVINNIKKNYSTVEAVSVIARNEYSKAGVDQVQLKQMVSTTYPSAQVKEGLFSANEFNIADGKAYKPSDRRVLMDIPQGVTIAQVQQRIDSLTEPTIYQHVSDKVLDVLSENQIKAISAGLKTQGEFEAKLLVRNPDGTQIVDTNGDLLTVYRQTFFSPTYVADKDFRKDQTATVEFELTGEVPTSKVDMSRVVVA